MIQTSLSPFTEQALPQWRRAVLKVGSSLLAADGGGLTPRFALGLAQFVSANVLAGREVVIVSSGAVAAGRAIVPKAAEAGAAMAARQALAALGQAQLIALWQRFFERPVAQVLLTHDDLRNRRRYLNARAALTELLALGALPVVNENDTVSVDELKLGDNDNLAAIVAALVDADALFIATDIDGLYTADPRGNPDARPINEVLELTPEVLAMAGGSGSAVGTGGMQTKLQAAAKAGAAGIDTFLFNGRDGDVVRGLAQGRLRGTRLHAGQSRIAARKYWLRHAPLEPGAILIDAGAARALRRR
jgi:glutamate 5-kinase